MKKKRIKINKNNLRDFWYNIKHANIQIICVPEENKPKKGRKNIWGNYIQKFL